MKFDLLLRHLNYCRSINDSGILTLLLYETIIIVKAVETGVSDHEILIAKIKLNAG
ncbi:hypothetical protein SDC9_147599 [bioreactor metagenome]|uniref:Uncharacterized protein n=1 Tax=bioreactor metagenome TaxID=1076179 RepID=A0A645EED0_9ZZZZ